MSLQAPHNGGQLARVFALLTAAFVAWSAYALATSPLPPLAADRGRIDSAITLNLIVSGIVFFGAHIGGKGAVPPDRLLAPLCAFVTGLFLLRTVAAKFYRKKFD